MTVKRTVRFTVICSMAITFVCRSGAASIGRLERVQHGNGVGQGRPANDPDQDQFKNESGCLEGRAQDYVHRHSDNGVIDPLVMLELSRDVQREFEKEKQNRRVLGISGSVWKSIGPTNVAGRATAIAVDPTNPSSIIIGAAGGGAWKTTDGGSTWAPLTDSIPNLSVGAIAIAPSSPSTVYLGTGEGGYSYDFIPGIGLLASSDGGKNWSLPTTVVASEFYKISVHPTNPLELVIATNAGAFRSTGGQNGPWTMVIPHDSTHNTTGYGDITDLVRDPSNPTILYAATWNLQGGSAAGSTVLKSIDGGQTWRPANVGLPITDLTTAFGNQYVSRIALAIAPSSPSTMYAATAVYDRSGNSLSHIYRTTDAGNTWSETNLSKSQDFATSHYHGSQVDYDNTIVVSPSDPNTVIAGGVIYVRSTDGGATWAFAKINAHVDAHEMRYAGSVLYIANDGGIFSSVDDGQSAVDRNTGLVTLQLYSLANDGRDRVFGGAQDNGTNRRLDSSGTTWDNVRIGDGMDCPFISTVPSIVLPSVQYGRIFRTTESGDPSPVFVDVSPHAAPSESSYFRTRVVSDPTNPNVVYTATTRLWKSIDGGESWFPLGTATTDGSTFTQTPGHEITSIAIAKTNPSIIMVAKSSYFICRSNDGGATWTDRGDLTTLPGKVITHVEIDPTNADTAYVTLAGVTGSSLYKTTNGGLSWSSASSGLPPFSAQVVRVDPTDSSTLYCGTDVGVYRSTDRGATWFRFGTGMPAVSVYDLEASSDGAILRAATHGRGAWELSVTGMKNRPPVASIIQPAAAVVTTKGSILSFSGSLSDPDAGDVVTGLWTFPDTWATTTGTSATHSFERAGVFPVTLLATDNHAATASATITVTVAERGDDCNAPIMIPGNGPFPWSTSVAADAASFQESDPGAGGPTTAASCYFPSLSRYPTIWFSITPASSGIYDFYTCGSETPTVVELWSGPACGPYVPTDLGCLVHLPQRDCGSDSKLTLTLTAGITYRVLLVSFGPSTLTVGRGEIGTVVTSVSPPLGPMSGGTTLAIAGSGFVSPASVSIGGVAATQVTVVSPTLITAVTALHRPGPVDIIVSSGGTSGTLAAGYTYLNTERSRVVQH